MSDDDMISALGPCCICRLSANVGNLMLLDFRAPVPGTGWGCVACDMPSDGAAAVLCDLCFDRYNKGEPLRDVVSGYAGDGVRVEFTTFPKVAFGHKPTCGAVPRHEQ